jgi:hypothetical protein
MEQKTAEEKKARKAAYGKAWRAANKDKVKAYNTGDRGKKRRQKYKQAHPEKKDKPLTEEQKIRKALKRKETNEKKKLEDPESYREKIRIKNQKQSSKYKEYRQKNSDKLKKYRSEHFQKNKEKSMMQNMEWRIKNWDYDQKQRSKNNRKFRELNRERIQNHRTSKEYREHVNKIDRQRYKEDPEYLLKKRLRSSIRYAVKNYASVGTRKLSALEILGCSLEEFKDYLSSKFKAGMSWDNHGEWHIDHIRPCSSFDLSNPEQQRICFHYTNLQPLWALENLRKSDKVLPWQEHSIR